MDEIGLAKIESMIYIIRGQKVMIDSDLAELYGVETKYLNKAVKRNILRFPEDFMFQLTQAEVNEIKKIKNNKNLYGGSRKIPFAFTENGVAMLSSVLHSDQAILINITIIRIFTKLRSFLLLEKGLHDRMNKLEVGTNQVFRAVFERLDSIEEVIDTKLPSTKRKIGLKD